MKKEDKELILKIIEEERKTRNTNYNDKLSQEQKSWNNALDKVKKRIGDLK